MYLNESCVEHVLKLPLVNLDEALKTSAMQTGSLTPVSVFVANVCLYMIL